MVDVVVFFHRRLNFVFVFFKIFFCPPPPPPPPKKILLLRFELVMEWQGSPQDPATGKNCHLLDLGTPATQGKYTYVFWGCLGNFRKDIIAGYLKFFSGYLKFLGEPWSREM